MNSDKPHKPSEFSTFFQRNTFLLKLLSIEITNSQRCAQKEWSAKILNFSATVWAFQATITKRFKNLVRPPHDPLEWIQFVCSSDFYQSLVSKMIRNHARILKKFECTFSKLVSNSCTLNDLFPNLNWSVGFQTHRYFKFCRQQTLKNCRILEPTGLESWVSVIRVDRTPSAV